MADADISVVGAGFVGLSLAIAAAQRGFNVEVVDQKAAPVMPNQDSSNVIAVNPASAEFLKQLGVWDLVPGKFRPAYDSMQVIDGTGTGQINFTAAEAGLPELGYIVNQGALLAALAARAVEANGVKLAWQQSVDPAAIDSPLVVGADGRHSKIREAFGLRQLNYSYDQSATVCLATFELPHDRCARQWFHETGPLALLPLSTKADVAVVWSSFDDLAELTEASFKSALLEASEGALGTPLATSRRFSFPLVQQHALEYCAEGVVLLGDAAHAIHPLAGQGANLGFADARALATELSAARLEGLAPGDLRALQRYERARKGHNGVAALGMEGFHRLFTSRLPGLGLLRNLGLDLVDQNARLKRLAIDLASGR